MESKYLRVSIGDNDFSFSLEMVSKILYETFQRVGKYPTEKDFPMLKEGIKHLWFGEYMVSHLMYRGSDTIIGIEYFEPHLKFVDYWDIPDWDNAESVYIPMFDGAEILER